ncbi:MAG TPA: TonB-dependent receptor, partial [Candidatus Polarisedimenticolia bacterium]|nr:TonB-dependent receptor [Candidatus Polarisedimenticolia bacterium]
MTTAILLAILGALSRLIPHPPNAVALGALALYSGARLPRRWAAAVPIAALGISDIFIEAGSGRAFLSLTRLATYGTFTAIVWLGSCSRGKPHPARLAGLSVLASSLFFLSSNLSVWAAGHLYPLDAAGLLACYVAAVPFFRNSLIADLLGSVVLFGIDALAARSRTGAGAARRVRATRRARIGGIAAAILLLPAAARAQAEPPAQETVVVTATLTPEEESQLGSATTVLTRERIEQIGATTLLEALRLVPGLDVVRGGSEGSVTSVFLRGANSTHALVLVDGVRVNSPYFSGYDFSAMTTENIERIEVVRGPFSSLYGSDAVGGVIQIFTRRPTAKPAGQVSAEGGNAGQRQGWAWGSGGLEPLLVEGSYRHAQVDGDRKNSDWRENNAWLRVDLRAGDRFSAAVEGSILDGEVGVPGPVGAESPRARGGFREERVALPVAFQPSEANHIDFLAAHVTSKPTFRNPDDPFGFTFSDTDAETLQLRLSDAWNTKAQTLVAFASWERWSVSAGNSFGPTLEDDRSAIWGVGIQESFHPGPRWSATLGARYDHHSEFGGAFSPRATSSWLFADKKWKARLSAGSAFRAPSIGELRYPFSGNPDLQPERSRSYEAGVERYFKGGRAEISLFWSDFRDLILFDFATFRNENIGRARARGVELAWRQEISEHVAFDTGYTYLDGEDRATGQPLLRRPRHRAFAAAFIHPHKDLLVSLRATFAGKRDDVDALTFLRVEDPSYVRFDLYARYHRL